MHDQDTPYNRMVRSILNLTITDPFFSSIIFNMKPVAADVGTMCTDGKTLRYDPVFVNACDQLKLDVVLVHEAVHVALGHPLLLLKLPDRILALEAAELSVNSLIYHRKGFPVDALLPGRGKHAKMPLGKSTEWYYDALKKDQQNKAKSSQANNPPGASGDSDDESTKSDDNEPDEPDSKEKSNDNRNETGDRDSGTDDEGDPQADAGGNTAADSEGDRPSDQGTGQGGSVDAEDGSEAAAPGDQTSINQLGTVDPYDLTDETPGEAERKWEQIVSESANSAASAGKLPGEFEELVNRVLGTTALPWPILLRIYLTRTIRHGRSYRRPNRRTLWRKDIQPSRMTKGLGKVVFGVDTSGSMDQSEMNKALATCIDIGKVYPDFELGIVQFDTQISHVDWFTRFNTNREYFKNWSWKGRGGTSYVAFFDSIAQYRADVVVLVTDGYPNDGWPDMRKVMVPVIWLITKEASIPENVSRHSKVIMLNKG